MGLDRANTPLVALNFVPVNVDTDFARFRIPLSYNLFLEMAFFVAKRGLREITIVWLHVDVNVISVGTVHGCIPRLGKQPRPPKY